MNTLQWSDDLALGVGAMDQTHIEFVDLLAEVQQAPDETLLAKWEELIEHTQVHFDNENRWMVETRFAAGNCHTMVAMISPAISPAAEACQAGRRKTPSISSTMAIGMAATRNDGSNAPPTGVRS